MSRLLRLLCGYTGVSTNECEDDISKFLGNNAATIIPCEPPWPAADISSDPKNTIDKEKVIEIPADGAAILPIQKLRTVPFASEFLATAPQGVTGEGSRPDHLWGCPNKAFRSSCPTVVAHGYAARILEEPTDSALQAIRPHSQASTSRAGHCLSPVSGATGRFLAPPLRFDFMTLMRQASNRGSSSGIAHDSGPTQSPALMLGPGTVADGIRASTGSRRHDEWGSVRRALGDGDSALPYGCIAQHRRQRRASAYAVAYDSAAPGVDAAYGTNLAASARGGGGVSGDGDGGYPTRPITAGPAASPFTRCSSSPDMRGISVLLAKPYDSECGGAGAGGATVPYNQRQPPSPSPAVAGTAVHGCGDAGCGRDRSGASHPAVAAVGPYGSGKSSPRGRTDEAGSSFNLPHSPLRPRDLAPAQDVSYSLAATFKAGGGASGGRQSSQNSIGGQGRNRALQIRESDMLLWRVGDARETPVMAPRNFTDSADDLRLTPCAAADRRLMPLDGGMIGMRPASGAFPEAFAATGIGAAGHTVRMKASAAAAAPGAAVGSPYVGGSGQRALGSDAAARAIACGARIDVVMGCTAVGVSPLSPADSDSSNDVEPSFTTTGAAAAPETQAAGAWSAPGGQEPRDGDAYGGMGLVAPTERSAAEAVLVVQHLLERNILPDAALSPPCSLGVTSAAMGMATGSGSNMAAAPAYGAEYGQAGGDALGGREAPSGDAAADSTTGQSDFTSFVGGQQLFATPGASTTSTATAAAAAAAHAVVRSASCAAAGDTTVNRQPSASRSLRAAAGGRDVYVHSPLLRAVCSRQPASTKGPAGSGSSIAASGGGGGVNEQPLAAEPLLLLPTRGSLLGSGRTTSTTCTEGYDMEGMLSPQRSIGPLSGASLAATAAASCKESRCGDTSESASPACAVMVEGSGGATSVVVTAAAGTPFRSPPTPCRLGSDGGREHGSLSCRVLDSSSLIDSPESTAATVVYEAVLRPSFSVRSLSGQPSCTVELPCEQPQAMGAVEADGGGPAKAIGPSAAIDCCPSAADSGPGINQTYSLPCCSGGTTVGGSLAAAAAEQVGSDGVGGGVGGGSSSNTALRGPGRGSSVLASETSLTAIAILRSAVSNAPLPDDMGSCRRSYCSRGSASGAACMVAVPETVLPTGAPLSPFASTHIPRPLLPSPMRNAIHCGDGGGGTAAATVAILDGLPAAAAAAGASSMAPSSLPSPVQTTGHSLRLEDGLVPDPLLLVDGLGQLSYVTSGAYAAVYRGFWNGVPVGIKFLSSTSLDLSSPAVREALLGPELEHDNIIRTYTTRVARIDERSVAQLRALAAAMAANPNGAVAAAAGTAPRRRSRPTGRRLSGGSPVTQSVTVRSPGGSGRGTTLARELAGVGSSGSAASVPLFHLKVGACSEAASPCTPGHGSECSGGPDSPARPWGQPPMLVLAPATPVPASPLRHSIEPAPYHVGAPYNVGEDMASPKPPAAVAATLAEPVAGAHVASGGGGLGYGGAAAGRISSRADQGSSVNAAARLMFMRRSASANTRAEGRVSYDAAAARAALETSQPRLPGPPTQGSSNVSSNGTAFFHPPLSPSQLQLQQRQPQHQHEHQHQRQHQHQKQHSPLQQQPQHQKHQLQHQPQSQHHQLNAIGGLGARALLQHGSAAESILDVLRTLGVIGPTGQCTAPAQYVTAVVMEYADAGNLDSFSRSGARCDLAAAVGLLRQVSYGMSYLHAHGLVHGDLKPANVLLMRDPCTGGLMAKVADFGLSGLSGQLGTCGGAEAFGTVAYSAPERLSEEGAAEQAADVYSFGVCMQQLVSGQRPFADLTYGQIIFGVLCQCMKPPWQPGRCDALEPLYNMCCDRQPAKRPTFDQVTAWLDSLRIEGDPSAAATAAATAAALAAGAVS